MEVSNLSAETLKEIQTYNVNEATITSEYRMSEIRESEVRRTAIQLTSRYGCFFYVQYIGNNIITLIINLQSTENFLFIATCVLHRKI